jgi:hypothetical protein
LPKTTTKVFQSFFDIKLLLSKKPFLTNEKSISLHNFGTIFTASSYCHPLTPELQS